VRRVLIAVVILGVLLVVIDRIAVSVANRAVAERIRTELDLSESPQVQVHGFPFLTQAVRGRYKDVDVRIPNIDSGPLQDVTVDARLQGVRAPLDDMIGGRLEQVPVSTITGTVAVRYDDLARASGVPGLTISPNGDTLRVTGQVNVAGRRIGATALARVRVVDGDLVVTAEQATIDGTEAPPAVLTAAARLLSFRVSPSELPLALRITGVQTGPESLTVSAEAHNVTLRRGLTTISP